MKTELLKVLYEEVKETRNLILGEQYRLRKEKIKTFIWVNIAVLSAISFITKLFKGPSICILILFGLNLFSIGFGVYLFSKEREVPVINAKEFYNNIRSGISEGEFYLLLIKNALRDIERESGSFKFAYRILGAILVVQFAIITAILFMEVL